MNDLSTADECPHCGSPTFKRWENLSEDELFIAHRMPSNADTSEEERRGQRVCTRCWFREDPRQITHA